MLPFRLADVSRVEFYKRDELTTDLICCDVTVGETVYFLHEEAPGWDEAIDAFHALPGFDAEWFAKVSQPPFAESSTTAFERP